MPGVLLHIIGFGNTKIGKMLHCLPENFMCNSLRLSLGGGGVRLRSVATAVAVVRRANAGFKRAE